MPEEGGFLRRWARRKAEAAAGAVPAPEPVQADAAPAADAVAVAAPVAPAVVSTRAADTAAAPLPTMADVAQLTRESDFSSFVARGVDADVRRSALKKLFSDPHFNAIDRLDVYMDDYTKPSPMSAAMLAGLQHAKSVFWRPDQEEAGEVDAPATAPAAVATADGMAPEASGADGPAAADAAGDEAAAGHAAADEAAVEETAVEEAAAGETAAIDAAPDALVALPAPAPSSVPAARAQGPRQSELQ